MSEDLPLPAFAESAINLASPRLGTKAIFATDEFFAPKERMLDDAPAVFIDDKYDDNGKWMDGWESRRRRNSGHDYCVVELGVKAVIWGVDIDTSHFTGNFPPAAFIEACLSDGVPGDDAVWTEIIPATPLSADAHHYVKCTGLETYNYLRLHILTEGRGINMGDGWETRRRREPGNDWIILKLGAPGFVDKIEVDTAYFKGNYPDKCSLQAAFVTNGTDQSVITQSMFWDEMMAPSKLEADTQAYFEGNAILMKTPVTHLRLNIHSDGGASRFRVFGRLTDI